MSERDAIILTAGYGRTATGKVSHNFGPISQEGGERRLNVAITRARRWMTVVSSFTDEDLGEGRLGKAGAKLFRSYLRYARTGGQDLGTKPIDVPLNAFEEDIRRRLSAAGIPLVSQLGVSGYRLDFACPHPTKPGRYVLAVEADGATYHSAQSARDRDRLRQEHLERLGWRFCRIWSTEWARNPEAQVTRVRAAYDHAVASADAEAAARKIRPVRPSASPNAAAEGPGATPPRQSATGRVGSCPIRIVPYGSIRDYSQLELVSLIRWIGSDTLLRTDADLVDAAREMLGFTRRGSRIQGALEKAVTAAALGAPPTRRAADGAASSAPLPRAAPSDTILMVCPSCRRKNRAPRSSKARCGSCGAILTAPGS